MKSSLSRILFCVQHWVVVQFKTFCSTLLYFELLKCKNGSVSFKIEVVLLRALDKEYLVMLHFPLTGVKVGMCPSEVIKKIYVKDPWVG